MLSAFILIALIANFIDINVSAAEPFSGNGTEGAPYIISSYEDLYMLRDNVNSGNAFADCYIKQTCDIIFPQATNWDPIGKIDNGHLIPFSGYYNGNGLICLGSANRVSAVVMYQNRIDCGNIDTLVVAESGNWLIIAVCVLHDNLSLVRKSIQELGQFPEFAFGGSYPKGEAATTPSGCMTATMLLPLETSIPTAFINISPSFGFA